jgi:hypothetical protein
MILEAEETEVCEVCRDCSEIGITELSESALRSGVQRSCATKQSDEKQVLTPVSVATSWVQVNGAGVFGDAAAN